MNLKLKFILVYLSLCASAYTIQAQNIQYDPLLDPAVEIPDTPVRNGNGEYIWYPGQLSAHLQQKRLKESEKRCMNVGYPGKFYAPVYHTSFRKEVILPTETPIEWTSTGKVKVSVNGKVSTDNWKASMDGTEWNIAETSPVFGTAGRMPLDDPETEVTIHPVSILPIRNATVENQKIKIQKNGYILVDFFHIEVGKVSFIAKGEGKLTAFVGESPEEALNENIKLFEQYPIESYSLTEGEQQIILPERAVRYLKIFSDKECEISDVKFKAKIWPVDFLMSFECNDERMNNIWNASVASLHTSTHGFYLDGIKRDYLPWSMDAVLSTFAGDYLFGYAPAQSAKNRSGNTGLSASCFDWI